MGRLSGQRVGRWIQVVVLVLGVFGETHAAGLVVTANPVSASIVEGSSAPAKISLGLVNEASDVISLLVWATTIQIVPEPGAVGEVLLTGMQPSDGDIFKGGDSGGPQIIGRDPALPASIATITDFSGWDMAGRLINAGATAELVDLEFTASGSASGKFSIVLLPLNPDEFSLSSAWGDSRGMGEQIPFGNSGVLATIEIITLPEPSSLACAAIGGLLLLAKRRGRCCYVFA
jgi:hypothetical protein